MSWNQPQRHFVTTSERHCVTCQCQRVVEPVYMEKYQNFIGQHSRFRGGDLCESRVLRSGDPMASMVGPDPINNRTVWLKSVSPRAPKIVIKVSSPSRPNLVSSYSTTSLHKKTSSCIPTSNTLENSRFSRKFDKIEQSFVETPYKAIPSTTSIENMPFHGDNKDKSTIPLYSEFTKVNKNNSYIRQ